MDGERQHAGEGPSPMAATKISARMISLMPRMQLSNCRVAWKTIGLGLRLRAAKKQTGRAMTTPSSVPQTATCRLSSAGRHSRSRNSGLGGIIRTRKSTI